MDSWATTFRLLAVMVTIAVFSVLGRLVVEALARLAADGTLPWP